LRDLAAERGYDVVWYSRELSWLTCGGIVPAPAVVDVDDLPDVVLRRQLAVSPPGRAPAARWRRARMRRDAAFWEAAHPAIAERVDHLVYASEHDRDRSRYAHSSVVPNTYPPAGGPVRPRATEPVVLFAGLLVYPANVDGARWLVSRVLPNLRQADPASRVVLAGRAGHGVRELAAHPGVAVLGEVSDMTPVLRQARVVAVPLRVGGGTRIKILEAFAHRVPVVSTSVGAEGLDVVPGRHLLTADSPEEFAAALTAVLADDELAGGLADRAYTLYARRYRPEHARQAVHRAVTAAVHR
jgi:glycosyltransferase involved in cell wall biosynthesis